MKELTNKDVYDFLEKEITLHPDLDDMFTCNLREHENDEIFWEELLEEFEALDNYCFTICEKCGRPMIEGYTMQGSHYCSDACLHEDYTEEQIEQLCTEDNDECYYTVWYEDSEAYKLGEY